MGTTPGSPGESAALKQPFREPSLEIAPHEIVGRRFLGEHLSSQRSEQPEGESGLLRDEPREWLSIEDPDPGILETQHRGRSSRLGQDPELAEEPHRSQHRLQLRSRVGRRRGHLEASLEEHVHLVRRVALHRDVGMRPIRVDPAAGHDLDQRIARECREQAMLLQAPEHSLLVSA
jgi:hypothetical protein